MASQAATNGQRRAAWATLFLAAEPPATPASGNGTSGIFPRPLSTGSPCPAGRVFPRGGVRDRLAEPGGVVVRPQAFEDGQRLGELRVRGGVVLVLAVEPAAGVQQPGLAVGEGHGPGAVQALVVGGPGQVVVAVAGQR